MMVVMVVVVRWRGAARKAVAVAAVGRMTVLEPSEEKRQREEKKVEVTEDD